MLGIYNYTVILTYIGMLSSFVGITFAIDGKLTAALMCLILSGACDMFDGKIAATKQRTAEEKHFGIEIDSLSDLICFGILPAVILYIQHPGSITFVVCSGLYALAALIRLAYFNTDEAARQGQTSSPRHEYRGLPVTSSALIIPFSVAAVRLFSLPSFIIALVMLLMAAAFLAPFRLKKPHNTGLVILALLGLAEIAFVLITAG